MKISLIYTAPSSSSVSGLCCRSSAIYLLRGDDMARPSMEIPDGYYPKDPIFVRPSSPTPRHTIYLSNLDDQPFLRFSIKYVYVYRRSVAAEALAASLGKALVEYYPLAGRLIRSPEGGREKLVVNCNGQGAVFAEARSILTADEFLRDAARPNRSWRKLLYEPTDEERTFIDVPPLLAQVRIELTRISCSIYSFVFFFVGFAFSGSKFVSGNGIDESGNISAEINRFASELGIR